MQKNTLQILLSVVSIVGMLWGIFFAFFGLGIVPVFRSDVLVPWSNGVYGSTLIGLCATIFFVGRHALSKNDTELKKKLLYGIFTWLVLESLFSLYYGVFLNFGVDLGIMLLMGYSLMKSAQSS